MIFILAILDDDVVKAMGRTVTRGTYEHVGPMVIKNCKEEFQHVPEFTDPLLYGTLSPGGPPHLLVLVRT